jgi:hypothetical protein
MATTPSKKGSPAWRRGVERARAQAVALQKRIGPNTDKLTDEERKKMLRRLAADLQRLVRAIDRHLGELPPNTPSRLPAALRRARKSAPGRR